MILKFLNRLLSSGDEVSSNRTIATIAFIVFVYIIIYSLHKELEITLIETYLDHLLIIIISGLGLKGIEKITDIIKRK